MEQQGKTRKFRVKEGAFTLTSKKEKIGDFVRQVGHLIYLSINGVEWPFHYSNVIEIGVSITIDCTPTWAGLLPLMLELAQHKKLSVREPILKEFTRMAELADSVEELQDDTVDTYRILLSIINDPLLKDKNTEKLKELADLVTEYQSELCEKKK